MRIQMDPKGGWNISAAFFLALLVQFASGVWWISSKNRDTEFLDMRVRAVEVGLVQSAGSASMLLERLARIEERVNAQTDALDRIEKRVSAIGR